MIRSMMSVLVLAGALAAGSVRAADLVFECHVQANQPDHGLTSWRRRIIIDPPTRTTRIQDDFGHGFVERSVYPFVSMNLRRVVLEEHGGKQSYIDRVSGEYVLRNAPRRFMLRGHCSASALPTPR
jgi:hypothetical protein